MSRFYICSYILYILGVVIMSFFKFPKFPKLFAYSLGLSFALHYCNFSKVFAMDVSKSSLSENKRQILEITDERDLIQMAKVYISAFGVSDEKSELAYAQVSENFGKTSLTHLKYTVESETAA